MYIHFADKGVHKVITDGASRVPPAQQDNVSFYIDIDFLFFCAVYIAVRWSDTQLSQFFSDTFQHKRKQYRVHISMPVTNKCRTYARGRGLMLMANVKLATHIYLSYLFFSSPEHFVFRVSYCDRPLSVVRRRPSCVVRRASSVFLFNQTQTQTFTLNYIRKTANDFFS